MRDENWTFCTLVFRAIWPKKPPIIRVIFRGLDAMTALGMRKRRIHRFGESGVDSFHGHSAVVGLAVVRPLDHSLRRRSVVEYPQWNDG